jgi:aldose sugar dehydrogenase
MLVFVLCMVMSLSLISGTINYSSFYAYAAYTKAIPSEGGPTLKDPSLKVEKIFQGDLGVTTSMAFLGPNDILLLERSEGNVLRIKDGVLMPKPLLTVSNVGKEVEWGMLGIAVDKVEGDNVDTSADGTPNGSHTYVFLYYTEPDSSSTSDSSSSLATLSNTPDSNEDASGSSSSSSGGEDVNDGSNNNQATEQADVGMTNRLYRYELVNDQLVNPKLLLSLPANAPTAGTENNHDGGKVVVGPDHNVYVAIGDVGGHSGQAQNVQDGQPLDGTSGILRVTENGDPVTGSLNFATSSSDDSSSSPSSLASYYYAYGIRNSFGIDFDPVTGNLWESENGADDNDEINLVLPGFNSGWSKVMGIAPSNFNPANELVMFDGNGKYRDPEFVSKQTIGPTALEFLHSNKLGNQYQDTIFMGDVNTGNLYNFKLNQDRTGLMLTGPLADKTADVLQELDSVIFGQGFGVITDIKDNPYDGFLYILGYDGSIYRITSNDVM